MLDRTDARAPDRPSLAAASCRARDRRRRALVACAALALVIHATFLDRFGTSTPGSAEPSIAPMSVRTMTEASDSEATEPPPRVAVAPPVAPPPPPAKPRVPRRLREPVAAASSSLAERAAEAGANTEADAAATSEAGSSVVSESGARTAGAEPPVPLAAATAAASEPLEPPVPGSAPAESATVGGPPPLIAAGERPPPVYPTRLPAAVTLHYDVRRGFLRGDGEIRWQPAGDTYRLVLEARIAGLTLLVQTSEGAIDGNGLAPVRFLDQRARRSAQAANFNRDSGRITFSGTTAESPLVAGAQDRLSWMIQLAGIVAADPALLHDGSRITMAVVGARGDAGIWSLRYVGEETVETASGSVSAVKLVREGRTANDTTAEIWLDPARSYLPAHATLRNASGASEYDLLFDRIDP